MKQIFKRQSLKCSHKISSHQAIQSKLIHRLVYLLNQNTRVYPNCVFILIKAIYVAEIMKPNNNNNNNNDE